MKLEGSLFVSLEGGLFVSYSILGVLGGRIIRNHETEFLSPVFSLIFPGSNLILVLIFRDEAIEIQEEMKIIMNTVQNIILILIENLFEWTHRLVDGTSPHGNLVEL